MDPVTNSIADHSLNSNYDNYDWDGDIYTYFGQDIRFWTGYDYGNSCYAWLVEAESDYEGVYYGYRNNSSMFNALCERVP